MTTNKDWKRPCFQHPALELLLGLRNPQAPRRADESPDTSALHDLAIELGRCAWRGEIDAEQLWRAIVLLGGVERARAVIGVLELPQAGTRRWAVEFGRGARSGECNLVQLVAGLFISSLLFSALMAYQARQTALQRDEARFQAQRAEASSEFMSLMLEEVGPGGRPLTPLELIDKGVELLDARYGADPQFAARMLLQMSRRYMDLNNTERQTQVLSRALSIARDLDDADMIADVECTFVRSELDANRHERAMEHMQAARTALARASKVSVATQVDCLRAEADIAVTQNDFATAADNLQRAKVALEEAGTTRGLQYHAVLTDLGGIYFRTSRFREALALNEQTAEALDRNGRGGTLGRVTVAVNRATILFRVGEVVAAEKAGLEALRRAQRMRGEAPATPSHTLSYATTLNRLGRIGEAETYLNTTLEQASALGNGFLKTLAEYQLARALMLSGKFEQARAHLEIVRQAWSANTTANRDRLADLARTQAELTAAEGRIREAKTLIDSSLAQFGHPSDRIPIGISAALTTASRIYFALDQFRAAETFAADALRISEGIARAPNQSADVGEALLMLAIARRAQSDEAGALAHATRAREALQNSLGADHALTREAFAFGQRR